MQVISSVFSLMYGITIMILLLNIPISKIDKKHMLFYASLFLLIIFANVATAISFGFSALGKMFTLTAQLPVTILLWRISKVSIVKVIFVTLTAIFLTFPSNMSMVLLYVHLQIQNRLLIVLILMVFYVVYMLIIKYFFVENFNYMLVHFKDNDVFKLYLVPIINYLATILTGGNDYFYSPNFAFIQWKIFLFFMTLSVYILFFDIFKRSHLKYELEQEKMMLNVQLEASSKYMQELKSMQEKARMYRHDIRHHITLINEYTKENDLGKIKEYVANISSQIDEIKSRYICKNETVNLILSSFEAKAEKVEVQLKFEIDLPEKIDIADTILCVVFSNGLENAIKSAQQMPSKKRSVHVKCLLSRGQLLLFIKNDVPKKVEIKNAQAVYDLTQSIGTKSIMSVVEAKKGYCSFESTNDSFTLKVAVPLDG